MPTDPSQMTVLLTVAEVAEFLKVSSSTVRRLQQRRLVPFIKVGGRIRFSANDVMAYVAKQRVEPVG